MDLTGAADAAVSADEVGGAFRSAVAYGEGDTVHARAACLAHGVVRAGTGLRLVLALITSGTVAAGVIAAAVGLARSRSVLLPELAGAAGHACRVVCFITRV